MLLVGGTAERTRSLPSTAACDAHNNIEVLFWFFGFPLLASLCGWLIYPPVDGRPLTPQVDVPFCHKSGDRLHPLVGRSDIRHHCLMSRYLKLRRVVDRDLSRGGLQRSGLWSFLIALWLAVWPVPLVQRPFGSADYALITIGVITTTFWLLFVCWRASRLIRATALRGDRAYDRHDKYCLAREYHDTHSATRTRRRR